VTALDALERDYRAALLRYLPRHDEVALARGYELGRGAVAAGVSLLDVARIHHAILVEVLQDTSPEEVARVGESASQFLLDVLGPYDMTQRGLLGQ
jgi:hypothetical protein